MDRRKMERPLLCPGLSEGSLEKPEVGGGLRYQDIILYVEALTK